MTEMNGKAALTEALDGIGVAAADLDIKGFTFEDGFTFGAAARLNDHAYAQVSERKDELGARLLAAGWAMMTHPPSKIVVIVEA